MTQALAHAPAPKDGVIADDIMIPSDTAGILLRLRNKRLASMRTFTAEKTVLMMHGATYSSASLFDVALGGGSFMDHLASHGYDVYAVDVRGYGGSTRPPEMEQPPEDIRERREDFGQTFGWWGMTPGPYLVLPILGPSSARDGAGTGADLLASTAVLGISWINDRVYIDPTVYGADAVDQRHQVGFRYYQSSSPFEYDLVRFIYTKKRELDVLK